MNRSWFESKISASFPSLFIWWLFISSESNFALPLSPRSPWNRPPKTRISVRERGQTIGNFPSALLSSLTVASITYQRISSPVPSSPIITDEMLRYSIVLIKFSRFGTPGLTPPFPINLRTLFEIFWPWSMWYTPPNTNSLWSRMHELWQALA